MKRRTADRVSARETVVLKIGGSVRDEADTAVAQVVALHEAGRPVVVVHGGGKAITRAMEQAGLKARFVQGQRVTDAAAVAVVDQVLSRQINPEIVATINALGGAARGFAGTDIFRCRKLWLDDPDPRAPKLDLGYVGEVVGVHTAPLLECIAQGITPVISPTARGDDGQIYNCNADVAAAQVAVALKARRLVFMSDVPGLLRDPKDARTVIPHLQVSEVPALKRAGVVDRGMIPKVDGAVAALQAGVEKVSFVDGRVPHAVCLEILTDAGVGTEVVL